MAKKVIIDLEVKNQKAIQSTDKLKKSVKDVNAETKKGGEASQKAFGKLDSLTGGAISKFKGLTKTIGGSTTGFKALRVAVIGSGIGALVIGVISLIQAFKRSEGGQNKFAKLMGVIGSVINNLLDVLADFGETIISVFENPKQAIKDFANLIKENIINRFQGIMELIPALGKAVSLLFKGEFAEAGKVAANAAGKVVLGVENVVEKTQAAINKTKEFVKELEEEGKIAAKIADKRAKADKIERKNIVDRANANQRIADLRFKAEQRDKFSAKERVEFLKEASALEEETTNKEIEAAKLRFEARKIENALGKSTKEDKNEEAELEARLIQLTTSKLALQKRLQTSITTFQNEVNAQKKAEADALIKENKEKEDKIKKDAKKRDEEAKKLKEKSDKERDEDVRKTQEAEALKRQARENTFNKLVQLAGAESNLGRAVLLAKQLMAAKELLLDLGVLKRKATNTIAEVGMDSAKSGSSVATGFAETLKLGFPAAIPALVGYAASAVGIVSGITSAVGKTKGVAGAIGGQGSVGAVSAPNVQAPSFSLVGASGTNQLASAIGGQEQQPIRAFVVSNDVTTAQSLDRNIIDGASLG